MNCKEARACLSSYYDGELERNRAREVEQHLATCEICQGEVRSFKQMTGFLSEDASFSPASDSWEKICCRLDEGYSAPAKVAPRLRMPLHFHLTVASLAIAASVMMLGVLPFRSDDTHPISQASATIDLSEIVELAAKEPSLALDAMARRFNGQEVAPEDAEALLGYQPAVADSLPANTRIVSTKLLTLPNCECEDGMCTCGPSGCNCAVSLCERKDGSEFLVLEHCRSQSISFGELAVKSADGDTNSLQFIGNGDRLAASWISDSRRLTAIGLKDVAEAKRLSMNATPATRLN